MAVRLYENARYLVYAPFYAAHATGAYAAEGVAVELLPSPGPGRAEAALRAGAVEVMWAGPMRVMRDHDSDPSSTLVCFAEIVARDPFSLVGRAPSPGFRLADLAGQRIATVSEVPTPWLCLQQDLREAGIDPAGLDRVADRGMADNLAALRDGRVAVVQLFEPFVDEAVAGGMHVWHQATARGRTSYTAFVTTREHLAADPEPLLRMTRAIHRTQAWIGDAPATAIADVIAGYFPTLARERLVGALARYQAAGVWGRDPLVSEDGFDRLRRGLVSGGLLKSGPSFAACVDNVLAREAMSRR